MTTFCKARAGITPGSWFILSAESCGCSFQTGGTYGSVPSHFRLPHGHCGYGHSGLSARLYSPFPVPICAGCPVSGGCRCIRHRRIPESVGSNPSAGFLLLLYSSRLPPCRICFSGKHRLYKVSILLFLHSQRLCNHYITNQSADPPFFETPSHNIQQIGSTCNRKDSSEKCLGFIWGIPSTGSK